MLTPTTNSKIDTGFFRRMGVTLVVIFSGWFALSLITHIAVLRNYEPKETAKWMIYVMYVPSRLSFLVWGPWLQGKAQRTWESLNDDQNEIDKMQIVNDCVDKYSQIDIQPIQDQLDTGLDSMHTIYVTIWICWALAIVELIVWVIYMVYVCSNRVNREHMKEHLEDDKQN